METTSRNSLGEVTMYLDLFCNVLTDSRHLYPSGGALARDIAAVRRRVSSEGIPFLTKTLPALGKAIDRSLETGLFALPREFKTLDKRRQVPALFESWFARALGDEGRLVGVSPSWLAQARQAAFLLYKLELPFTPEQEKNASRSFLATEEEISNWAFPFDDWDVQRARDMLEELFLGFKPRDITPRHGPGAVAGGERGGGKWIFRNFYRDLHSYYPYDEYLFVAGSLDHAEQMALWRSLVPKDYGTSKVVFVPKDSRGPRTIACEPLEKQFIQQGLGRSLMRHLEKHPLTQGHINFESQNVNRELARSSSLTREFATLDLKDASDRVSLELVRFLFPEDMYQALLACRSAETRLPDGSLVTLKKYASMGSALCFPVEACVFWALCVSAIVESTGRETTEVARDVYVYGDDLIVRSEYMDTVVEALEKVGLAVNLQKSFRSGEFRESCGMDAFRGIDVTPLRVQSLWSGRPGDAEAYASYVSYANGLATRGYSKASSWLWKLIESTYGKVPYGTLRAAYPCRVVSTVEEAVELNSASFRVRVSPCGEVNYQQLQVFAAYLRSPKEPVYLDSWPRLLRALTAGPGDDPSHVTHPHSVQLRRGWIRIS